MTIRNLERMFRPRSIAFIGASKRTGSVGLVAARNLLGGGFDGPIWLVNPHETEIAGTRCFADIVSLPGAPDLALIATPPDAVPGIVAELGRVGTTAAVVITAGFAEGESARGRALMQAMSEAARPYLLRLIGPNSLGLILPNLGVNASFAHLLPLKGEIAFVAQSGAVLVAVIDWAAPRGIGFSHVVSLGNMADVDFGDTLDYLANDPETRAILVYIEGLTAARKFMSAARAAARLKPVIAIKAGRHALAARAVSSHTGALAGADAVYSAAFRRAGVLRAADLEELFAAVETLALVRNVLGDRLAIVANGGGIGILATDALLDAGGKLAELAPETMAALNAALPPTWSHGNPVDLVGDADGARYRAALRPLLADPNTDAVLVLNCPTAVASNIEAAKAVAEAAAEGGAERPVLASWIGEATAADAKRFFAARRIPAYDTPAAAVRGFMHMVRHRRNQDALMETPPALPADFAVDRAAAGRVIDAALAEGRTLLNEPEAKSVLAAYGIPVPETRIVATPDEAAEAASVLGLPVVLKVLSRDITHKSDVGGVALDLATPQDVRTAAMRMTERVRAALPKARLAGFTVQPMVRRPGAFELILGASEDPQFGPVLLFGQGGTSVEVVGDTALALPPLNLRLARMVMEETRIFRLLKGYRDRPPAAIDAVALALVRVSQLVVDFAEIVELDVNPLLADATGVLALDARIGVRHSIGPAERRLAIRPYPQGLECNHTLADGTRLRFRPIRPEDEPGLRAAFARLSTQAIRMRFFGLLKELPHAFAARLSQIDYDREMAFVAVPESSDDGREIFAVARFSADPDNERAEYALTVRTDVERKGLGTALLTRLIDYARSRNVGELYGEVLRDNSPMLALIRRLSFTVAPVEGNPEVYHTRLKLRG